LKRKNMRPAFYDLLHAVEATESAGTLRTRGSAALAPLDPKAEPSKTSAKPPAMLTPKFSCSTSTPSSAAMAGLI
jgi:hypothetical protein